MERHGAGMSLVLYDILCRKFDDMVYYVESCLVYYTGILSILFWVLVKSSGLLYRKFVNCLAWRPTRCKRLL
jgi:hypothetical protein